MIAKYDGYTIKNCLGRNPWLCPGLFHATKTEVIEDFEGNQNLSWKKCRRRGDFKIVKVKLVEVE